MDFILSPVPKLFFHAFQKSNYFFLNKQKELFFFKFYQKGFVENRWVLFLFISIFQVIYFFPVKFAT